MKRLFGIFLILFGVILLSAQPSISADLNKDWSSIVVVDDFGADILVSDILVSPDFDVGKKGMAVFKFDYNKPNVTVSWDQDSEKETKVKLYALHQDSYIYKSLPRVANTIQLQNNVLKSESVIVPLNIKYSTLILEKYFE